MGWKISKPNIMQLFFTTVRYNQYATFAGNGFNGQYEECTGEEFNHIPNEVI